MRRRNVGCRARRRLPSPSDMIRDPFLKTEGIHNFRDYGGYPAAGGGRVKTGLLFRSGQHFDASESDLAAIEALDIRTIIDLRGASERESRSEEHTSELQSLMRISYAVFCLKKNNKIIH